MLRKMLHDMALIADERAKSSMRRGQFAMAPTAARTTRDGDERITHKDAHQIIEAFDGLQRMAQVESILETLQTTTKRFMDRRGHKEPLTLDELRSLVRSYGIEIPSGRVALLHRELCQVDCRDDGRMALDLVSVVECLIAQKLFNVFVLYSTQTPGAHWAMKPMAFVRLLEDAGFVGGASGMKVTVARAIASRAWLGGKPGFDFKDFLVNLARVARAVGIGYDDLVFEMRPLEHRLTQDNHFVRLVQHNLVQQSQPIRQALLRAAAQSDKLDLSEEHEHMRRRRIAQKVMGEHEAKTLRATVADHWNDLSVLSRHVHRHRSMIRTLALAKNLGETAERNNDVRAQEAIPIPVATSPQATRGVVHQPGSALMTAALSVLATKGIPVSFDEPEGTAPRAVQTSVYGYAKRPALRVLFGGDARQPAPPSPRSEPEPEPAARPAPFPFLGLLGGGRPQPHTAGSSPSPDRSAHARVKDPVAAKGAPEASVPEASMADAVAAPGPVDPAERRRRAARKRYVTGTTFAIDRLWTDHRGSFDVMLKRSKGLRFLVEVFQDLCFVDGGVELVKPVGFARAARACGWPRSDHVFARFSAEQGLTPKAGMTFVTFARAIEYMSITHGMSDFTEVCRELHQALLRPKLEPLDAGPRRSRKVSAAPAAGPGRSSPASGSKRRGDRLHGERRRSSYDAAST